MFFTLFILLFQELLASTHNSDENDGLLAEDESGRQQTSATHLGTLDTQVNDEEYAEISDLNTTTEQSETPNQSSNNQRGEITLVHIHSDFRCK